MGTLDKRIRKAKWMVFGCKLLRVNKWETLGGYSPFWWKAHLILLKEEKDEQNVKI